MPVIKTLTPGGGSAEQRTPIDTFKHIDRKYQFNYDAFAAHNNALCELYSTLDGTFWAGSPPIHLGSETGLETDWRDMRVWMNPPYGRGILARCMKKASEERSNAELIAALIPVAPGTQWWQKYVAPYADVYYLPGRVHFLGPNGERQGAAGFDSCVVVYRRLGWI